MSTIIQTQNKLNEIHKEPFVLSRGEHIGCVKFEKIESHLLSSYDGTEIVRVLLGKGSNWTFLPKANTTHLESVLILKGHSTYKNKGVHRELKEGDFLSLTGFSSVIHLVANEATEIIYTTSKPVFENYGATIENVLNLASQVEEKDGYTAEHCNRIKTFSMILGEEMNLDSDSLYSLSFGSQLHDIGKVKVPDNILGKPDKLTAAEWDIMRKHTLYGTEIIRDMNLPFLDNALPIIEQHHERYNGSGYPFGLKKEEIHTGAAIVAVVDSYDAMTSDRVYQKGRSKEEAIEEIQKNREILYHPEVVDAFLDKVDEITS